jgi:hypothetical protein
MTTKKILTDDLAEALRAITSLTGKLSKVLTRLRKGTPQHSLAKNRLKALRVASTLLRREIGTGRASRRAKR